MTIINPTYKNLEKQTINNVLNFIPEDSRLDYIKHYSTKEEIKQYNDLMLKTLDNIINVHNNSLCVSMMCYVDDYNMYTDAGLFYSKIRKKTLGDLVKAHPVLSRLFVLSQKYKLFEILFDCIYFTPYEKLNGENFTLKPEDVYKTKIENDRPDVLLFDSDRDKMFDSNYIDEMQLDYGYGTYPSIKHSGFVFHFNIRLTNFHYIGKALTMADFGAEVASYLLWFSKYQDYFIAQYETDVKYYNEYRKMYSEAPATLTYIDNHDELQYMMFNFPKTVEWWEENYRQKYVACEKKRENERKRQEYLAQRKRLEEESDINNNSRWRANNLENNLDYNSELDDLAKKMTPGYVLSPEEYINEIDEFLNMNLKTVENSLSTEYLCDDMEHINWNAKESLRNAHQYAVNPFNRAKKCQESGLFEVSENDIKENDDINKKELACYYNLKNIEEKIQELNPEGFEYDYQSMYYCENTITERDLSEFDAIIQEIDEFNKTYGVKLLKDIDPDEIPDNAIYVETVPYKVSDIYLDGLIPKLRSEQPQEPVIEQSASGILYGKEVSNEDKYLLNTSIYKELLRIANTFAINLDSIVDIYYNIETNKMYIKLPKKFVSKHIYTLYNKKFNVISRTQYIENTVSKCTTDTATNRFTVYRCNVYNPYKPRNVTTNKTVDMHGCDRDDGYG